MLPGKTAGPAGIGLTLLRRSPSHRTASMVVRRSAVACGTEVAIQRSCDTLRNSTVSKPAVSDR